MEPLARQDGTDGWEHLHLVSADVDRVLDSMG